MPRLAKQIEDQLFQEYPEKKAQGLRPVVMWVPDMDSPELQDQIRRDIEAIRASPSEEEIMDWLEKVRDWPKD